ncbi:MAG: hypothetical protein ACK5GA_03080, partial [Holosporaceae bacterium]
GGWGGRSSYGGGSGYGGGNSGGGNSWGRGSATSNRFAGGGKASAEPPSYARQLLMQNRDNSYSPPQPPPMRRVAGANPVSGTISGTVNGIGIGSRVRHKMFGDGTVTAADGTKLEVRFDRIGHKKVMASFVTSV